MLDGGPEYLVWELNYPSSIGQEKNIVADALSCSPIGKPHTKGIGEDEVQVAVVCSSMVDTLLLSQVPHDDFMSSELPTEQSKDPSLRLLIDYLQKEELPGDIKQSRIIVMKAAFYFINTKKRKCKLPVVPRQMQKRIMEEHHGGPLGGQLTI